MIHRGKIGRLPRGIREELNRRLREGEKAAPLLEWLHAKPEVTAVLEQEFAGARITPQNVSEWRAGGFAKWEARQEQLEEMREQAAEMDELMADADGRWPERMATALALRYAALLNNWNGEVTEEFCQKLKVLRGLCQDITGWRRADQSGARLKMEQERVAQENEDAEEAVVEHFQRWVAHPKVREVVRGNWTNPEECARRLRFVFGLSREKAGPGNDAISGGRHKKSNLIQPNPS